MPTCDTATSDPIPPGLDPLRVARWVGFFTSTNEVNEQLIQLLHAKGATDREINLKLTSYLEANSTATEPRGCCLYGGACCQLTEEECGRIGGTWVGGGNCV